MSDNKDQSEVYRIQVPNPATQLQLGEDGGYIGFHVATDVKAKQFWAWAGAGEVADGAMEISLGQHESGFEGFVTRVGSGSGFIAIGGGAFGLSRFEDFAVAFSGISTGLGALGAVTGFVKNMYYRDENAQLGMVISGLATTMALAGAVTAITNDGIPKGKGTLSIYGDYAVNIAAPLAVTMRAVGSAALGAGISAGIKGMVATDVGGGLLTTVTGLVSAAMSASKVSMVGDGVATVAARHGEARLEGATVIVGAPSGPIPGLVREQGVSAMKQEATKAVRIEADDVVELGVAKKFPLPMAKTRLRAMDGAMRVETEKSALLLDDAGTLFASGSILRAESSGVTIGVIPTPPKTVSDAAVTLAETAYEAAMVAADLAVDTSATAEQLVIAAAAGVAVGSVTAAAAVAGTGATDAGAVVGGILGGTAAGALVGTLGTMAVVSYLKGKLADEAASLAKDLAATARNTAHEAALTAEGVAIDVGLALPTTPKIEVTNTSIVLSVGTSKLTIDATGIKLSNPAGVIDVDALTTNVKGTVSTALG